MAVLRSINVDGGPGQDALSPTHAHTEPIGVLNLLSKYLRPAMRRRPRGKIKSASQHRTWHSDWPILGRVGCTSKISRRNLNFQEIKITAILIYAKMTFDDVEGRCVHFTCSAMRNCRLDNAIECSDVADFICNGRSIRAAD